MNYSEILTLVTRIRIDRGYSLLGIHPIISVVLGSDDTDVIFKKLQDSSFEEINDLCECIDYCTKSSIYPHEKTVWIFNDMDSDIRRIKFLNNDDAASIEDELLRGQFLNELSDFFEVHKNTYPFIETAYEELDEADVLKDNPAHESGTERIVDPSYHGGASSAGFLIPTLALSSLLYYATSDVRRA